MSHTGQCIGGPEDGNLIESDGDALLVLDTYAMYELGDNDNPIVWRTRMGEYKWDESTGWRWTCWQNAPEFDETRR